jgi:hypothetical protein
MDVRDDQIDVPRAEPLASRLRFRHCGRGEDLMALQLVAQPLHDLGEEHTADPEFSGVSRTNGLDELVRRGRLGRVSLGTVLERLGAQGFLEHPSFPPCHASFFPERSGDPPDCQPLSGANGLHRHASNTPADSQDRKRPRGRPSHPESNPCLSPLILRGQRSATPALMAAHPQATVAHSSCPLQEAEVTHTGTCVATPSGHRPLTYVCVAPLCPGPGARSVPADADCVPTVRWYALCNSRNDAAAPPRSLPACRGIACLGGQPPRRVTPGLPRSA